MQLRVRTEQRLFFQRESWVTSVDDAQMTRAEIVERSPVELLLDDRRRCVRAMRDCRCIRYTASIG